MGKRKATKKKSSDETLSDEKPIDADGMMADIMKELTGESDEHDIEIEEIQDILDPNFGSDEEEEDDETETTVATNVKQQTVTENRHTTGKEATYKERIRKIIVSSKTGSMTLQEIYEKMEEDYPTICRKESREKWKNSVRHNLSLHKKTFFRTMLGQRSEWCVIMSYDETDPTNPSKMTFSRENIPLNNNKGMPGRPPKRERSSRRSRREYDVEIKIPVSAELFRQHMNKKRRLYLIPMCEKERLEKYYFEHYNIKIEQLQHERTSKTVLPAQFGKMQADRSTSPVIRFDNHHAS